MAQGVRITHNTPRRNKDPGDLGLAAANAPNKANDWFGLFGGHSLNKLQEDGTLFTYRLIGRQFVSKRNFPTIASAVLAFLD